LTLCIEN